MKISPIAGACLAVCVIATPASANWFDNFMVGENHKKLVGSAVTPTPDDLRATGDSSRGEGKTYHFDPRTGHWHEVPSDDAGKAPSPPPPPPQPLPAQGMTGGTPAPVPRN